LGNANDAGGARAHGASHGLGRIGCLGLDALRAIPPLGEESEEDDMSLDDTAAGLCWSSAGILVMEDGLIYGRGIAGRGWRSNFGVATPTPSFASVLVCALAGIAATAALLIASSAETVAAVAGLTP
jgi:hypothetical protein